MNGPESLQAAFVLHSRPYRESSLLVDLFTASDGIVPCVARGVRGKKTNKGALLQPFQPIWCQWRGRGELVTLTSLDAREPAINLPKKGLYSGLYVNEIVTRLLHRHDPQEEIFNHYARLLPRLKTVPQIEVALREFELDLLEALGYGLSLDFDIESNPIQSEQSYWLTTQGMLQPHNQKSELHPRCFEGRDILAILARSWQQTDTLRAAKRLLRIALEPHLGDRPLQSRSLFRSKLE